MKFVTWMNGSAGRWLRALAGIALMVVGAFIGGTAGVTVAIVGLVPLFAGLAGVCLLAPLAHVSPRAH